MKTGAKFNWPYVASILSLTLVYTALAFLSYKLAPQHAHVTSFWLPYGMALFTFLIFGLKIWPAIFFGGIIFTQLLKVPWSSSLLSGFGDMLSPLVGALLLTKSFKFNLRLKTLYDATVLILFGILIPSTIGAIIGTISLYIDHIVPNSLLGNVFLSWWLADVAGALILTPLLLAFCLPKEDRTVRKQNTLELILLFSLVLLTCWLLFVQNFGVLVSNLLPLCSLIIFITWGALRFDLKVTSSILMMACVTSIFGSHNFFPESATILRGNTILHFQLLLGTLSGIGLLLCAATRQHYDSADMLHENMIKLQLSEERLKLAINAANMGIWNWELSTGKVYWTGKVEELFGLKEGEFAGDFESFMSFIYPEDRPKVQSAIDDAMVNADAKYTVSYRIFWKDDEPHWLESIGHVYRDESGKPIKMAGVVTDITVNKQFTAMRDKLFEQEKNARLEAEKSIHQRDDFLSVASHELRTPLTSVLMSIQLIKRQIEQAEFDTSRTASLLKSVGRAELNLNRFIKLVSNLLDVSQITSERLFLDLKSVNLSELLVDIIERFRAEFNEAKCDLHLEVQDNVIGELDLIRIEQVITNLFTNAMKYGPGKPIDIKLARIENIAVISVKDYGIGMPQDGVKKIFERFERIGPVREYGGLGLGLFITKNIVDAHGGTIEVQSQLGEGSTFTVKLPLS